MITACTRCTGQVIERNGLDGHEAICLNCGFGQVANITPTEKLSAEAEEYNLRNRSSGVILSPQGIANRKGNHISGGVAKIGTKGFQKRVTA
jgi:hypothetical protein